MDFFIYVKKLFIFDFVIRSWKTHASTQTHTYISASINHMPELKEVILIVVDNLQNAIRLQKKLKKKEKNTRAR